MATSFGINNRLVTMQKAATLRATFSEAIALINKGSADVAETLCRETLEQHPDDANITALLGAILVKKGQLRDAETMLRKAIELAPSFAKPHEDLGHALLQMGRPKDAIEVLQNATWLDPSLAGRLWPGHSFWRCAHLYVLLR
jgi:predicted Zn-dependent protease